MFKPCINNPQSSAFVTVLQQHNNLQKCYTILIKLPRTNIKLKAPSLHDSIVLGVHGKRIYTSVKS